MQKMNTKSYIIAEKSLYPAPHTVRHEPDSNWKPHKHIGIAVYSV